MRPRQHFRPGFRSPGLKIRTAPDDGTGVEASSGIRGTAAAAYEARMAERGNDQQKIDGANAVRLVEAAQIAPPAVAQRTLPLDATISIRA
jgi:hypothetical protein